MSKEEVEKRLGDLKDIAVRAQEFLAASKLVAYLEKDNILYRSVRDIKIFLLLDGE